MHEHTGCVSTFCVISAVVITVLSAQATSLVNCLCTSTLIQTRSSPNIALSLIQATNMQLYPSVGGTVDLKDAMLVMVRPSNKAQKSAASAR
jgi:hypothetical protein